MMGVGRLCAWGCAGFMGRGNFMHVIDVAAAAAFAAAAFAVAPAEAREVVAFRGEVSAGTIVVRTTERRLYYVLGDGRAIRYPVGVGKTGRQWSGVTRIDGKYVRPAWSPPAVGQRDKPSPPDGNPG